MARGQPCSGMGLIFFKKQENIALEWFREGRNNAEGAVWVGGSPKNSPCLGDPGKVPNVPPIPGLQQLFPKFLKAGQYCKS